MVAGKVYEEGNNTEKSDRSVVSIRDRRTGGKDRACQDTALKTCVLCEVQDERG